MAKSKTLLAYSFISNISNAGDKKYSFNDFGNSSYDIIDGFIGGLLASTNTFNLNQDWKISFYYQWRSQLTNIWDHLFAFGVHKSTENIGVDIVSYAIGFMKIKPGVKPLYIIPTIDPNKHFYEISYIKKAKTITVYIDNKLVNIIENITMPDKQYGLYLSGGANGVNLNCKINDFVFDVTPDVIEVVSQSPTKTNVIQSLDVITDTLIPGAKKYVEYSDNVLERNVVITLNKGFIKGSSADTTNPPPEINNEEEEEEEKEPAPVGLAPLTTIKTYVDGYYLVHLNFDSNFIQDFGSLQFTWNGPPSIDYFVESKISIANPIRKSLYFDGTYYAKSHKNYPEIVKIDDFCVEIDFVISDELKFSTPYSRVYLASANLNTYGEYHSSLADFYLLPKYQDEENTVSLTVESNDLYRNTGNIIYTYGWLKRNTPYRIIYVRNGHRFYMLINDELVFDKTLDRALTYEPGYSKPNRRYLGGNYLSKLEVGLGRSVLPTNKQDSFIGYIDKFNISGVARFDVTGKPLVFIKEIIIQTNPIKTEFSTWFQIYKKCITIEYGQKFTIFGHTIIGGVGGTKIIGCVNKRVVIYSSGGEVEVIRHEVRNQVTGAIITPSRRWVIPANGHYAVIYNESTFSLITKTIEFNVLNIIYGYIVFIGGSETYIAPGIKVIGAPGGCILFNNGSGEITIRSHVSNITVIDTIKNITHIVVVGYMITIINKVITIVVDPFIDNGRRFPIPSWVRLLTSPEFYPPRMVQYVEEDVLVYIPCKYEEFQKDVIYSKIVPREINYKAIKIGGNFYRDYWREGYGAIGPK